MMHANTQTMFQREFGYPWEGTLAVVPHITPYCPMQRLYNPYIGGICWYISRVLSKGTQLFPLTCTIPCAYLSREWLVPFLINFWNWLVVWSVGLLKIHWWLPSVFAKATTRRMMVTWWGCECKATLQLFVQLMLTLAVEYNWNSIK